MILNYNELLSGQVLSAARIDLRRPFSDTEDVVTLELRGTGIMEHIRMICAFHRETSFRNTLRLEGQNLPADADIVREIETACGIAVSVSESLWELYFPDIEEYNRVILPRLQVLIYFPDPFSQDKIEEDIERIRFKTTSV